MRPGWLAVWTVAVVVAQATGSLEELKCCPGDQDQLIKGIRCPNNSTMRLNCHGGLMYALQPNIDNFTIDSGSGNLVLVTDIGERRIGRDRFCTIARLMDGVLSTIPLLCFEEETYSGWKMMNVYSYCLLISDVFLVITFAAYCILPSLRDLQGKCVMCFVAAVASGYLCLSLMQLQVFTSTHPMICVVSGFVNYYLFLCIFFWLFIISFNIWRTARHVVQQDERTLWIGYLIFGYGGPLVMLCIALITHHIPGGHLKPRFGERSCWFSEKSETWAFFYGPMALLLLGNITFFFMTVIRLWKDYRDTTPISRIRALRFKCLLYLKLFLAMGISWIFEIISFLVDGTEWYVTDILNCLQGVIIFFVMVATRKRVLRALAKNETFGSCFNKSWQTMPDEESEQFTEREQIQLANQ